MTSADVADYLRRIREATTPVQVTDIQKELIAEHSGDDAMLRLGLVAALRSKRLMASN